MKTHFKQTETFLHTHFTSFHPPNVKKGFVKGEAWGSYEKTPQKQPLRKIPPDLSDLRDDDTAIHLNLNIEIPLEKKKKPKHCNTVNRNVPL